MIKQGGEWKVRGYGILRSTMSLTDSKDALVNMVVILLLP